MEIQCPKCHFVQPKDQYCARCGVDMQKYKPQNTSLFKKLNVQTSILFFIALLVLGVTIYFFRSSDKPLASSFLQSSSVKSFRTMEKQATTSTDSESIGAQETSAAPTDSADVDLKVADEKLLDQFSGAENSTAGRGKSAAGSDEFANPRLKISFVEISHDNLNALLAESQSQGLLQRDGDQFKGILTNISLLAQYKYKTLKQEVKEMRPNQIEAFFFGKTMSESSQFLGIQLNLEKKSGEGNEMKWLLTVNTSKLDTKESEMHDFSINKNSALYINAKSWITSFENERLLSDTAPFSILSDSDFLNQSSEIIILLEFY